MTNFEREEQEILAEAASTKANGRRRLLMAQ